MFDFIEVVKSGDFSAVLSIIHSVDPSEADNEAFKQAAEHGHLEIVQLLLNDPRVDPAAGANEALSRACQNGHVKVVEVLMKDARVDPSDADDFAIMVSAEKNHTEIVKLLLQDKRVDAGVEDSHILKIAAKNGNAEIVKLLLQDKTVDPCADENIALEYACSRGYADVVKLLLADSRVSKNPTGIGFSTINAAADNGHREVVLLLSQCYEIARHLSVLKRENSNISEALSGLVSSEECFFWFAYGCIKHKRLPLSIIHAKISSYLYDIAWARGCVENACILAQAMAFADTRKFLFKKPKNVDTRAFLEGLNVAQTERFAEEVNRAAIKSKHSHDRSYCLLKRDPNEVILPGSIVGIYDNGVSLQTNNANFHMVVPFSTDGFNGSNSSADLKNHTHCLVAYVGEVLVRLSDNCEKDNGVDIVKAHAGLIGVKASGKNDGTGILIPPGDKAHDLIGYVLPGETVVEKHRARFIKVSIRAKLRAPISQDDKSLAILRVDFDPYATAIQKGGEYMEGTRKWIFDKIMEWFANSSSQVFVLMGHAGVGKSVLCAELCKHLWITRPASLNVQAVHFFKHDDQRCVSARSCIYSIAQQLSKKIPTFKDALLASTKDLTRHTLDKYDLTTLFSLLILEPGVMIQRQQKSKVVVLIDALDECEESQRTMLLNIIQVKWKIPWLLLVVSTRPQDYIPHKLRSFHPVELNTSDDNNTNDLRVYIKSFLQNKLEAHSGIESDVDAVVDILLERSQGLFLYLRFLNNMFDFSKKSVLQDIKACNNLPVGIIGVYEEYFSRLKKSIGDDNYLKVLAPLVVARTPLPLNVLYGICGIDDFRKFRKTMQKANSLLYVGKTVRVVHKSMVDWLINDETDDEFFVDPELGHKLLAKFCKEDNTQLLQDFEKTEGRKCPLQIDTIFHLCKSSQFEDARNFIMNFTWLQIYVTAFDPMGLVWDVKEYYLGCNRNSGDIGVKTIVGAIEKGTQGLRHNPDELPSQLLGRIPNTNTCTNSNIPFKVENEISKLLQMAKEYMKGKIWICPMSQTLLKALSPHSGVLLGRQNQVHQVAFSKDSRRIATAGGLHVLIWEIKTGSCLNTFSGHESEVKGVAFSPVRNELASCSTDKTIRVWDLSSCECKRVLYGHKHWVTAISYSLDGTLIGSVSMDFTVRVWDVTDEYSPRVFRSGLHIPWYCCCFSGDSKNIIAGGKNNDIHMWSVHTGDYKVLKGHFHSIMALEMTPDSKYLISGGLDRHIRIWDMSTLKCVKKRYADVNVRNFTCSPDNKVLYTVGLQYIKAWRIRDMACINVLASHPTRSTNIAHSYDGSVFAVVSEVSPEILFYNAHSNPEMEIDPEIATGLISSNLKLKQKFGLDYDEHHIEGVRSLAITVTSKRKVVVSTGDDCTLRFWDLEKPGSFEVFPGHTVSKSIRFPVINDVAYSPNGENFALAAKDGMIYVCAVKGGKYTMCAKLPTHQKETKIFDYAGDDGGYSSWWKGTGQMFECSAVSFSLNGKFIVSGGTDKNVCIWNLEENVKFTLSGHTGWVTTVAFSQDDELIASGSEDSSVRIWKLDIPDFPLKTTLNGHEQAVTSVNFARNNTHILASAGNDNTIRIWDLSKEGTCIRVLTRINRPLSVCFSPCISDKPILACGCGDGVAYIFDAYSGTCIKTFEGHESQINCVEFSPDGKYIATSSSDETSRVWAFKESASPTTSFTMKGHSADVRSISFAPDGKTCISAGFDSTFRVWNLDLKVPDDIQPDSNTSHKNIECIGVESGEILLINTVDFSPDGEIMAAASGPCTYIYIVSNQKRVKILDGHTWLVSAVKFSPDGKKLATGGVDNNICVWNLGGMKKDEMVGGKFVLENQDGSILSLAFADDKYLVSSTSQKRLCIWDLSSRLRIQCIQTEQQIWRLCCLFSSTEHYDVIIQNKDGSIFSLDIRGNKREVSVDESTIIKAGFVQYHDNVIRSSGHSGQIGVGFTGDAEITIAVSAIQDNTLYYAVASTCMVHLLKQENQKRRSDIADYMSKS